MTRFFDAGSLIQAMLCAIFRDGVAAAPRGLVVTELTTPMVFTLQNPDRPFLMSPIRRANYRFGMAEACWICSGSDDVGRIAVYNRRMHTFSDDGETLWGAYGPRLIGQLPHVLRSLSSDADSRQAVITTWRPQVGPVRDRRECAAIRDAGLVNAETAGSSPEWDGSSWKSKDTPCTVAWHFQLRDDALNLAVFMRSNDVWLGTPYDVLSFTTVQRMVASMLGVRAGLYHHIVSNLHLYESNTDEARALCEEPLSESPSLPNFGFNDLSMMCVVDDFNRIISGEEVTGLGFSPYTAIVQRKHNLWADAPQIPVR